MSLKETLLNYSFENKLTHVPSALSMLNYVHTLFSNKLVVPGRDKIVLGKPFGSQTYYIVWRQLGYIDKIERLSLGVKHDEIEFVDFSEETMGNALGVAIGIAIANRSKLVWVNLTDATLQMGSTLEAIQYIGHNCLNNIVVTVDYNDMQVTGRTSDVLDVQPIIQMTRNYGWRTSYIDGHDSFAIKRSWRGTHKKPRIYFYQTVKGYGVEYMESDPVKWHYRPIEAL